MAKKWKAPESQTESHPPPPPHLPADIVESILAQLPVKSIIRFKSVSKLWNQITCHPHFAKIQSQHVAASPSLPTHFLVQGNPDDTTTASASATATNFCVVNFKGERFQLDANLGTPFGEGMARTLCYCNGLVLLSWKDKYVVWNPCSRMHRMIPHPSKSRLISSGLCYDPTTADYKVVMIDLNSEPGSFSVFSCKRRVWIKKNAQIGVSGLWIARQEGVYVDGACYWICTREVEEKTWYNILCFNGIEDKFERLQLPQPEPHANAFYFTNTMAVNLRGRLGLIYVPPILCPRRSCSIHIMIMENKGDENSWRCLRSINIKNLLVNISVQSLRRQPQKMAPCPISDRLVVIFFDLSRFFVYDVCEERVMKGPLEFPKRWNGMLVPFHQHLLFPMSNYDVQPKKTTRRRKGIPLN